MQRVVAELDSALNSWVDTIPPHRQSSPPENLAQTLMLILTECSTLGPCAARPRIPQPVRDDVRELLPHPDLRPPAVHPSAPFLARPLVHQAHLTLPRHSRTRGCPIPNGALSLFLAFPCDLHVRCAGVPPCAARAGRAHGALHRCTCRGAHPALRGGARPAAGHVGERARGPRGRGGRPELRGNARACRIPVRVFPSPILRFPVTTRCRPCLCEMR